MSDDLIARSDGAPLVQLADECAAIDRRIERLELAVIAERAALADSRVLIAHADEIIRDLLNEITTNSEQWERDSPVSRARAFLALKRS